MSDRRATRAGRDESGEADQWLQERTDILCEHITSFGMHLDPPTATALITERLTYLTHTLGMDQPQAQAVITDDAVRDMAEELVIARADEAPGAQLLEAVPDTPVTPDQVGHAVACLAEAAKIFVVDPGAREIGRVDEVLTCISVWAHLQLQAGVQQVPLQVPRALLHRSARLIDQAVVVAMDVAATHPGALEVSLEEITDTLVDAATAVRSLADEERTTGS